MASHRQLVVFDFDWSMADQDTDRWVFEINAPRIRRWMEDNERRGTMQFTDMIAQALRDAHAAGVTREQLEHALRIMPFHPAMVRAITNLKAAGNTTFLCLSNANSVYIDVILQDKGLTEMFDEVVTNPASWDPSGLLVLRRRVDPSGPQHACAVGCSANMCKGEELEAFYARHTPTYERVVYVGDGSNDYCPALRLRSQDMLLCRTFGGLHKRIAREGGLKCEVKYWTGAWEVEEIFNTL
ncbi:phosphatase phospho-type [Mycena belliarum]|uniref:Phosphatase phospho-type n=1 Tax=Mycena belliarum TaxID=1033014 RepID=A0AAD6TTN9_9AGAR|nr:phosphatase phospho-type [Mycena belliae]